MKTKFAYLFIIVILIIIDIYALVILLQYKKDTLIYLRSLEIETERNLPMQDNIEASFENNGMKLYQVFGKNSKNEFVNIKDLYSNEYDKILVCRFSETNCETCVDFAIKNLLEKAYLIGNKNIVFLGSYFRFSTV